MERNNFSPKQKKELRVLSKMVKRFTRSTNRSVDHFEYKERNALIKFIISGRSHLVHFLLYKGANPNRISESLPLFMAIRYNRLDLIKMLIKYGANPNIFARGRTPLRMAYDRGNYQAIQTLIEAGATPLSILRVRAK